MRYREIKPVTESNVTLTARDLTKHGPERLNNLIKMINSGDPLYLSDGTPIIINPSEAQRIKNLYDTGKFGGVVKLKGQDEKDYSLGQFLKTKEFGGQSVPPGKGDGEITIPNLRPGPTFQHGEIGKTEKLTYDLAVNLGAFKAGLLGDKIIKNSYLDAQGRSGAAVKEIAKEIDAGSQPTIPNLTEPELSNIQKYAFEYLGVQQLIKGIADFPNAEDFYKHLGTDIQDLILYFPKSSGNPLSDSYALVNKISENNIGISSKGPGGGSPSSIQGLKLSSEMQKLIEKDPAITFIDLIQKTVSWKQPFVAVNWIHKNYPKNLGDLEKFLPFSEQFLKWCETTHKLPTQEVPAKLSDIPEKYRELYKLVQDSITKTAVNPLFYDVRYYVKDILHKAVRQGVIPNFNARMLELLGENFIVLKTEREGKPGVGKFITHVQWPSKVGGRITFEHKDPAAKWSSAITWKLN